jgi:hypothetical protein
MPSISQKYWDYAELDRISDSFEQIISSYRHAFILLRESIEKKSSLQVSYTFWQTERQTPSTDF